MIVPKFKYGKSDKKIIFFSGAGISAPSGISTFRDSNGLWENHNVDQICNEFTWKNNFELVHKFYNERRVQLNSVEPNIAHKIIADISHEFGAESVFNLTQNVDDLFERAGVDAIHLHGFLPSLKCEACGHGWDIGYTEFDVSKDRCPKCNSLRGSRPDIVFFGGQAPNYAELYRALDFTMHKDSIIVVIGTMGNVVAINDLIKNSPCKKILCNMESSKYIDESIFDKVYLESIESAIFKIEKDIREYWS